MLTVNFFVKNKDWGRGRGGLNREGGLINFPPLKRGGLLERGGLIEDLQYAKFWGDKQRALGYVMVFSGVVNSTPREYCVKLKK